MKLRPKTSKKKTGEQLSLEIKSRGGARLGSGRKKTHRSLVNHVKRPELDGRSPMCLTWKLSPGLKSIRGPSFMRALARAFRLCRRFGLRIVEYSVQWDHLHLVVEAKDNEALERGTRSLGTSVALIVRKLTGFGYRGKFLIGRYHLHVLQTPTEVRNALRYVLFNRSKHEKRSPHVDAFSSVFDAPCLAFVIETRDAKRIEKGIQKVPEWQDDISKALSRPRTWLLSEGWLKVA